jgi:hypothetical protein
MGALALLLLLPAAAGGANKKAHHLKARDAVRQASARARAVKEADPLAVDSRVGPCSRVGTSRFDCPLSVIEDLPDGLRSCDWSEAIKRTRRGKLRSRRLTPTRCARPNLAATSSPSWFPFLYAARLDDFQVGGDLLHFGATATGLGAHASAAFTAPGVIPGRRYSFSVQVDVVRAPPAPQAAWFVWVTDNGSGIYELMGSQVTRPGLQTLSVSDVAPPGASRLLCGIGNGGPSRDGRSNFMYLPQSSEFIVHTDTATLLDGGKA